MLFDILKQKKAKREAERKKLEEEAEKERQRAEQEEKETRRERLRTYQQLYWKGELFPGYVYYWGDPKPGTEIITGELYNEIEKACLAVQEEDTRQKRKVSKDEINVILEVYKRYKQGSFIGFEGAAPFIADESFFDEGARMERARIREEERKALAKKTKIIKDNVFTQERIEQEIKEAFRELELEKEQKKKEQARREAGEASRPLPETKPQERPQQPQGQPRQAEPIREAAGHPEPQPQPQEAREPLPEWVPIKESLPQREFYRSKGGRPALLSSKEYKQASETKQRAMREAYYFDLGRECLARLPEKKQALFTDQTTGKLYKGIVKQIGRASEGETEKQYNYIVNRAVSMLSAGESATKVQKTITHLRSNRRA